jgi:hypothetical protein
LAATIDQVAGLGPVVNRFALQQASDGLRSGLASLWCLCPLVLEPEADVLDFCVFHDVLLGAEAPVI